MAKPNVVSDRRCTAATAPSKLCTPVLQAADEAGTFTTQSEVGVIWQVST